MILNQGCDKVFQAQSGGGAMSPAGGGMAGMGGGMSPVGGMAPIGGGMSPMGGGMSPMGGGMGAQGGGANAGQAKQELEGNLKTAQSQGWKAENPQLKMKLESALGHPIQDAQQQGGAQKAGGGG